MSLTIEIALSPEAQAILRNFETLPPRMLEKMRQAMDDANNIVLGQTIKTRFRGVSPRPFPPSQHRLRVRTARLWQSLRASKAQIAGGNAVQSSMGSNVVYFRPHEFGSTASGTTTVRSFTRRQPSRNVRAPLGPRGKFQKLTATGIAVVRSHSRRWKQNIPARAPLRTGIEENIPLYSELLSKAVLESVKGE